MTTKLKTPVRGLVYLAWLLLVGAEPTNAKAGLSEPPNVLFGFITISNVVADASRTDLVIQARRSPSGPAIASYRIGTTVALREAYLLEIPTEATVPTGTASSAASTPGTALHVVLLQDETPLATVAYTVGERGKFQRLDFVVGSSVDNNGLPDAWEIVHFGVAGQSPEADPDSDGLSNLQEYMAGTDPNKADAFKLNVSGAAGQVQVSFFAKQAQGPGYEGKVRVYSLESSTNAASGIWQPVAGFTSVFGNNQTLVFVVPGTAPSAAFFRAQATTR